METKKGVIYCLKCPLTYEVKYIGKTTAGIHSRLAQHMTDCIAWNKDKGRYKGIGKRNVWLRELRNKDLKPIIEVLTEAEEYSLYYWEAFFCEVFASSCDLLNTGKPSKITTEYQSFLTMSKRAKKKKRNPYWYVEEWEAKMRAKGYEV